MADLQLTSETFDDGGPIPERCSRDELERAMRDHVLEEAELMGTYAA